VKVLSKVRSIPDARHGPFLGAERTCSKALQNSCCLRTSVEFHMARTLKSLSFSVKMGADIHWLRVVDFRAGHPPLPPPLADVSCESSSRRMAATVSLLLTVSLSCLNVRKRVEVAPAVTVSCRLGGEKLSDIDAELSMRTSVASSTLDRSTGVSASVSASVAARAAQ